MTMQTLSLCNTHPPLIPSTKPLKTSTISIFKTFHKTPKKCYKRLTVFAIKEEEEQSTPSWAKPDSNEPPPWARNEAQQESSSGGDLPFGVYLLASAITAIAAIGSVFEYVNQKPVFGVLESDSIFYAPVLGFFAITGLPTAGYLWFKSVQVANKEAEEQDRRDGYR
ncbi:hypothetical protein CTI12_AA399480 [Artemisia annua]|uniref:Transmembrane protein n=1 Tax=Artemisia annua TaxID=35608 RepID=A0A2U1LFE0_ARTAN|nr:hypothetical protein CTI12_AA399480 [Artemisia annua]